MNQKRQSQHDSSDENTLASSLTHPSDEELTLFFYEELPSSNSSCVAEHLNNCKTCQTRLANWKRLKPDLDHVFASESETEVEKQIPHNHSDNHSDNHSRNRPNQVATIGLAIAASLLIGVGGFLWGLQSNAQRKQANIISELRNEIGVIKEQLVSQGTDRNLEELNSELEQLRGLIANIQSRPDGAEFERIYRQLVALANQTDELREEITSLAVNAHLEINKTRQAVAQLFVNREITNQTFESP